MQTRSSFCPWRTPITSSHSNNELYSIRGFEMKVERKLLDALANPRSVKE